MKTKMDEYQNSQKIKFKNPDTEFYMRSVRLLLLMINSIFILNGCLMIVVGATLCSHHYSFSFFYAKRTNLFVSPFVTNIILGALLLAVTVYGFFAILKQSTDMLTVYVLMLTNILFFTLGGAITAFTDDNNNVMQLKDITVLDYARVPEFQAEMDTLQVALHCCGNDSFLDYAGVEFTSNHSTMVVSKVVHGEMVTVIVPESCCATSSDVMCNWLKTEGCKNALINDILQNYMMIAELKIPVIFVELLGVVFALLFQCGIRKLKISNEDFPKKSSYSQSPDNLFQKQY